MSNIKTWFSCGVALAAVLAVNVARAEERETATSTVEQDVISETAPAERADKAEARKADAAKAVVVDENARVVRSRYSADGEGQGQLKQK